MKKSSLILLLGAVGCVAAFLIFYFAGTASSRELMRQPQPELAWLKKEFKLSDSEFGRISQLHAAYLPACAVRCQRIEEQNQKLRVLFSQATNMTTEIQSLLAQRATMRAECEAEMMKHFIEVSRTMPPEQGRRYLAWVEAQTFLHGQAMEDRHRMDQDSHTAHNH